jgi:hypothetical protein
MRDELAIARMLIRAASQGNRHPLLHFSVRSLSAPALHYDWKHGVSFSRDDPAAAEGWLVGALTAGYVVFVNSKPGPRLRATRGEKNTRAI